MSQQMKVLVSSGAVLVAIAAAVADPSDYCYRQVLGQACPSSIYKPCAGINGGPGWSCFDTRTNSENPPVLTVPIEALERKTYAETQYLPKCESWGKTYTVIATYNCEYQREVCGNVFGECIQSVKNNAVYRSFSVNPGFCCH
jgi:hypothetical protein